MEREWCVSELVGEMKTGASDGDTELPQALDAESAQTNAPAKETESC